MKTQQPHFPWKSFLHPRYAFSWLGVGTLWLISKLPYALAIRIGQAIGIGAYAFAKKRRHITEVNLALCFPELSAEQQQQLCKNSFMSVGIGLIEMALAWWKPIQKLTPLLHIKGIEHLHAALNSQQGLLILGAHFTTLDLVGRLLSSQYALCVTYRNTKDPLFDAMMQYKRETFFSASINRHDIRQFIRILKNKGMVWYAPDQDYGAKHSVFAPFFGIPAATITATSRLTKLGKALILPCFQNRLPNNQGYLIEFQPVLQHYPSEDEVIDATRINQILEQAILRCPEQYLWQHRRFKTRPNGSPRLY